VQAGSCAEVNLDTLGPNGAAYPQALDELGRDRHELVTHSRCPRHQRHRPVPGDHFSILDHFGATCHDDRPARAIRDVEFIGLKRDDRVINLPGGGGLACRAQHDEPVHKHKVHRSHGRKRVHGEDQPPKWHAREQTKALGATQPRKLTRCRRVAAVTHCVSVIHARAVRPGPKVPDQVLP